MNKDETAKVEYINTPFSYTRQQQGLTLLQQNIMTRISAHLQGFFNDYWSNKELQKSKERPRTFMTDEQIEALGPIRVELSELGISAGTYERVKEAVDVILNIKINGMVVDEEGEKTRRYNVVSYVDYPRTDHGTVVRKAVKEYDAEKDVWVSTGEYQEVKTDRMRGYIDITLNKDLIKSMLDITSGYVSHPENIAQIGRVPNMPLMYYFVRHHMNNFKDGKDGKPVTTAKVELSELREYLGMTKKNTKGEVVQEKYPTYSQFKSKVLKVALDDIKRICDEGLINFYFTVKEIRPRGKQKGTPSWLVFEKIPAGKKSQIPQQPDLFSTPPPVRQLKPGEAEWLTFLASFNGFTAQKLRTFPFKEATADRVILDIDNIRKGSLRMILNAHEGELAAINAALSKAYHRQMSLDI